MIDACSLQPDIDLLPFGDQTEIGERVCTMNYSWEYVMIRIVWKCPIACVPDVPLFSRASI